MCIQWIRVRVPGWSHLPGWFVKYEASSQSSAQAGIVIMCFLASLVYEQWNTHMRLYQLRYPSRRGVDFSAVLKGVVEEVTTILVKVHLVS
jgi:hypothetical protein